mmetsp:Transcript_24348/g.64226  ORF Transcript_24348/g.64226 Transcript_24348/m.64226 type:complete len:251 (+) Transcript_24348:787-1539(+)
MSPSSSSSSSWDSSFLGALGLALPFVLDENFPAVLPVGGLEADAWWAFPDGPPICADFFFSNSKASCTSGMACVKVAMSSANDVGFTKFLASLVGRWSLVVCSSGGAALLRVLCGGSDSSFSSSEMMLIDGIVLTDRCFLALRPVDAEPCRPCLSPCSLSLSWALSSSSSLPSARSLAPRDGWPDRPGLLGFLASALEPPAVFPDFLAPCAVPGLGLLGLPGLLTRRSSSSGLLGSSDSPVGPRSSVFFV